jgi:hypothetical protein
MLLSGNKCALPQCEQDLIDPGGDYVGKIAHIEAAEQGGKRFNPASSDEERRMSANLIIVCANCHDRIDGYNWEQWSVDQLKAIKAAHEDRVRRALDSVGAATSDYALADLITRRSLPVVPIAEHGYLHLVEEQMDSITRLADISGPAIRFEDDSAQAAWSKYEASILSLRRNAAVEFFPSAHLDGHYIIQRTAVETSARDPGLAESEADHDRRLAWIDSSVDRWHESCRSFDEAVAAFFKAMMNLDLAEGNLHELLTDARANPLGS